MTHKNEISISETYEKLEKLLNEVPNYTVA